MATFFRLSSCSSSAIVDMEKVVSISSGDLLYRELLRPNWSSFPDPDNLKNDHQFTKLLLPLKKMKKIFLLVKIYLLFWLFFRANFKLTNERSSFCFILILNWEFDGNFLNNRNPENKRCYKGNCFTFGVGFWGQSNCQCWDWGFDAADQPGRPGFVEHSRKQFDSYGDENFHVPRRLLFV